LVLYGCAEAADEVAAADVAALEEGAEEPAEEALLEVPAAAEVLALLEAAVGVVLADPVPVGAWI
jgi:hypothetical protein